MEWCYAECSILFIVMLSVFMLSVVAQISSCLVPLINIEREPFNAIRRNCKLTKCFGAKRKELVTFVFMSSKLDPIDAGSSQFGATPFHQLVISLTWNFVNFPLVNLPFRNFFSFVNFSFHQLAILSTFLLSTCHFVNLPFCQLAISSTYYSDRFSYLPFWQLFFCQLAILSTFLFTNLPFWQPSFHHFAILTTFLSSTCHFVNFSFYHFAILTNFHFINFSFVNLAFHLIVIASIGTFSVKGSS